MSIQIECEQGGPFKCPHCNEQLGVADWDTEYNYPQEGEHDVKCPVCSKEFLLGVHIEVHYAFSTKDST